jgi:DNA polymerase III delta prime subunit
LRRPATTNIEIPGARGNAREYSPTRKPAGHLLRTDAPKSCLLLGPPGCGKTATSLFLTRRLLQQFIAGTDRRIPLLLPGHEVAEQDRSLWDSIHRHFGRITRGYAIESHIQAAREGNTVLLLDGFDESPVRTFDVSTHLVQQWAAANPSSTCIVTSRPLAAPAVRNFREYEFAPFNQDQVRQFVRLRLSAEEADRFLAALRQTGNRSIALSSPFLLGQFIELFRRTGVLPDPATFTFADLVNRLFPQDADPDKRIAITALLTHLARRMTNAGVRSAPTEMLRDIAQSNPELFAQWNSDFDRLVNALVRTGWLVAESGDQIAFGHLSVLESFAKAYTGPLDQIWTPPTETPNETIEVVRFVDQELIQRLAKQPGDLYRLSPRRFEELIAELFRERGWSVDLTKQTRDGGADIIAVRSDMGSHLKMLIEAKKYGPDHTVGVGLVRQLYAVRQLKHASKVILATTSHFSPDAYREFDAVMPWEIELSDYDQIVEWLQVYRGH